MKFCLIFEIVTTSYGHPVYLLLFYLKMKKSIPIAAFHPPYCKYFSHALMFNVLLSFLAVLLLSVGDILCIDLMVQKLRRASSR